MFSLLIKENKTKFDFNIDWIGFQIPNRFVVGFGLDYNENFRDINHIVTLSDTGLDRFKKKKSIFAGRGGIGLGIGTGAKSMIIESEIESITPTKKNTSLNAVAETEDKDAAKD